MSFVIPLINIAFIIEFWIEKGFKASLLYKLQFV